MSYSRHDLLSIGAVCPTVRTQLLSRHGGEMRFAHLLIAARISSCCRSLIFLVHAIRAIETFASVFVYDEVLLAPRSLKNGLWFFI